MPAVKIRPAYVAGQFYPDEQKSLKKEIERLIDKNAAKEDVIACVLPHAGYIYSGKVAAETVSRINIKDKIILLGPNHTGYGADFSIMTEGAWLTPLGQVNIDSLLAKTLLKKSRHLQEDASSHEEEHSLEVELPFLQYFKKDFEIIPIAFKSDNLKALIEVGSEIAKCIEEIKDKVLIVASSDMTHYEAQANAEKKDKEAIKAILELDEDNLFQKINELDISMCGYAPVIAMISAAKNLGAKQGKLIKYQTSGDVTQDFESVVGYAGIIIS